MSWWIRLSQDRLLGNVDLNLTDVNRVECLPVVHLFFSILWQRWQGLVPIPVTMDEHGLGRDGKPKLEMMYSARGRETRSDWRTYRPRR